MICYTCSRPATHRIYSDLKPVCGKHLVEAVDEEGGDITIDTIDFVHNTVLNVAALDHNNKIDAVTELMRKLYDIKKRSTAFGLSDLSDWLDSDLEKVCMMLDELRNDLEGE